jgi:hypothetical protein
MGLDTSHNCFHGAYSTFNRFRISLGNQIGINIYEYDSYGGSKNINTIDHGILPLLNHSDCEGELSVSDCMRIVNGLDSILANFDDTIEADFDFKDRIVQFRNGCLLAISENEEVDFH